MMICFKPFSSSSSTTKRTGKKKPDIFDRLPDDVVIDILSRLPAAYVVRCRRVCKRWSALILSSSFSKIFVEKAVPGVLIQSQELMFLTLCLNLFLFHKSIGDKKDQARVMKRVCCDFLEKQWKENTQVIGSCNGLIALRSRDRTILGDIKYMVFNPVTREHLVLPKPPVTASSYQTVSSASFFYHPSVKEYRLLISYQHSSGTGNHSKILIFGLKSGGGGMWKELGVVPYRPHGQRLHAVHNNSLHWMADAVNYSDENEVPPCRSSIITFNMTSEEFDSMPHPGSECPSRRRHCRMALIAIEGKLTMCCPSGVQIDIWVLEDYENRSWSKTYKVDHGAIDPNVHILCFADGELYLTWWYGWLFRYHLKKNTFAEIDVSLTEFEIRTEAFRGIQSNQWFPYTPSFVSLSELVPAGV